MDCRIILALVSGGVRGDGGPGNVGINKSVLFVLAAPAAVSDMGSVRKLVSCIDFVQSIHGPLDQCISVLSLIGIYMYVSCHY